MTKANKLNELKKLQRFASTAKFRWTTNGDPIAFIQQNPKFLEQNPDGRKIFGFEFGPNQTKVSGNYTYDDTLASLKFCITYIRSFDRVSVVSFLVKSGIGKSGLGSPGEYPEWKGFKCFNSEELTRLFSILKLSDTESSASLAKEIGGKNKWYKVID